MRRGIFKINASTPPIMKKTLTAILIFALASCIKEPLQPGSDPDKREATTLAISNIQLNTYFQQAKAIDAQVTAVQLKVTDPNKFYAVDSPYIMRKIIALQNLGKYYPELYRMTELQLTTLFGYTAGRTIVTTCEDTYHSNMDACDNAMYVHTLLSVFGGGAATLVSGPGWCGSVFRINDDNFIHSFRMPFRCFVGL